MHRNEIAVPARMLAGDGRLAYIDGLRGLAILAVLFYHAYARWPQFVPFGSTYAVPPLSLGWTGVQLFFLISGFVIFMTLERCRSLTDFAFNRWSRLFPAMLVCSVVIMASAPYLPERPHSPGQPVNALVGLTFIAPHWWSFLNLDLAPIELAFWSLFVEVQFYAVAGLGYFLLGKRAALLMLAALFLLAQAAAWSVLPSGTFLQRLALAVTERLGAVHYGWFIAGALLYLHRRSGDTRLLAAAVFALASSCLLMTSPGPWLDRTLALATVSTLFVAVLMLPALQRHFAQPGWLFLGYVSYPLYLNHENLMVALIIRLERTLPGLPHWLLPALPMAFAVGLAYLVARYAERPLQMALKAMRERIVRWLSTCGSGAPTVHGHHR